MATMAAMVPPIFFFAWVVPVITCMHLFAPPHVST
jgi:hypothetical protein